MAEKKDKTSAKAKATASAAKTKATPPHPGGRGGKEQQAGGPEHRGADAREDKNP